MNRKIVSYSGRHGFHRPDFINAGGPSLRFKTCQYIHGDPKDGAEKCGATTVSGSAYCEHHHRMCFDIVPTGQRGRGSHLQKRVLEALQQWPTGTEPKPTEIANFIGTTDHNVRAALQKLERKQVITRKPFQLLRTEL